MSRVRSRPSSVAQILTLYTRRKLFNISFMPAMLIGNMDFQRFIPFSMTLTLTGGYRVSAEQNLLASCSRMFHLMKMKFDVVMKQLNLNVLKIH